jgi:hypothetical protein
VAKSDVDPGHGRLLLRAGTGAHAELIKTVHWSGLEAAYLDRVQGWPETPRSIGERVKRWRKWLLAMDIDVIVGEVDVWSWFGVLTAMGFSLPVANLVMGLVIEPGSAQLRWTWRRGPGCAQGSEGSQGWRDPAREGDAGAFQPLPGESSVYVKTTDTVGGSGCVSYGWSCSEPVGRPGVRSQGECGSSWELKRRRSPLAGG